MYKINVSAKVIYDISHGMYRSPANALKELISNAFDADSNNVVIRTNRPLYKTITYYDDGEGMSQDDFKWALSHIGGSRKREGDTKLFTKNGRPIIGKIGIGMLAIAQICRSFTVISTKKGIKTKFEANVDLKEFEAPEVYKLILGDKDIPIGSYTLTEYKENADEHYTKFILQEIREDFKSDLEDEREQFTDYSRDSQGQIPLFQSADSKDFRDFIDWLQTKDIRKLKDYWRLLWELALYSPIEYFNDGPVKYEQVLAEKKRELANYNFAVEVDGFNLRKPIVLPVDKDIITKDLDYGIYLIDSEKYGIDPNEIKFTGYIYNQRKQIKNTELQGILIRIKNIAIGKYDKSYLNCPISLGPVASFNSGEIYINHGLEAALNIDRNSFKESNRQYKTLQKYVYELMSKIYTDTRRRSVDRNAGRKENKLKEERKKIQSSLNLFSERYPIRFKTVEYKLSINPEAPFKSDDKTITIFTKHKIFETKGVDKIILEKMLILLEAYNYDKVQHDTKYYKTLIEYLKK
ncbi:MAG: ATP-binding protein [Deltaproteobacteria bacterium]|nr:ATP-binding protein [Deltaproteobacteria bacterium]